MNTKKLYVWFILVGYTLLLASQCSIPIFKDEEEVKIEEIGPVRKIKSYSTDFVNCGVNSPRTIELTARKIRSLETKEELILTSSAGGGLDIPPITKINLEAAIEKHYSFTEKSESEDVVGETFNVKPQSATRWIYIWEETRREGLVHYTENGRSHTARYSYQIGTRSIEHTLEALPCPRPTPTPTPVIPTPTPTPVTPPPTPTPEPAIESDNFLVSIFKSTVVILGIFLGIILTILTGILDIIILIVDLVIPNVSWEYFPSTRFLWRFLWTSVTVSWFWEQTSSLILAILALIIGFVISWLVFLVVLEC